MYAILRKVKLTYTKANIMGKYISGIASKQANLDALAQYAERNSVDYAPIREQSKRDLAPCGTYGRD
jgi:hypothetical protein